MLTEAAIEDVNRRARGGGNRNALAKWKPGPVPLLLAPQNVERFFAPMGEPSIGRLTRPKSAEVDYDPGESNLPWRRYRCLRKRKPLILWDASAASFWIRMRWMLTGSVSQPGSAPSLHQRRSRWRMSSDA